MFVKQKFRQTRYPAESQAYPVLMYVNGQIIPLKNWSKTGIGFELSNPIVLTKDKTIQPVVIKYEEIILFEGEITIRTEMKLGASFYYGASFSSGLFLTEGLLAAEEISNCIRLCKDVEGKILMAKDDFCRSLLALSAVLRQIQKSCENEENRWKNLPLDRKNEAEHIFVTNISSKIKNIFFEFNRKISSQVDIDSLKVDSIYHQLFHDEIYPYFEGADIVRRAYEKPRKYAGDYEMMNQIYRTGFEGRDLFSKVLHNYITNENSGESVKFRVPYFCSQYEKLFSVPTKEQYKVLAIASGPSVEVQRLLESWTQDKLNKLHVTLLDMDSEALEHAQAKILDISFRLGKNINVDFLNLNVKSFFSSKFDTFSKFDFIYSAGFFDYINNENASIIVKSLISFLNDNGVLIVGNFLKNNLTKAFLSLLTQWTLIHKDESEMLQWVDGLSNIEVKIEYDNLKMFAFLIVRKNATH